ncbi:MAG TPA: hypothetical protein VGF67_20950 [Ktedonobacteraceae bacterium]
MFDHFFEVIVFIFLSGGSLGALLRWFVRHLFAHRERLQEQRNEELRLQIRLEQGRRERAAPEVSVQAANPLPKDIPWDERAQTNYEQSYQQQG